jgi:Domain of unknown function (DUF6379)
MMDHKMIVPDSLMAVDGGFSFEARLPYYRGLGLSMVEDIAVTINGETFPREAMRFAVRGKAYTLDEMETCYDNRWNFGEKATITVLNGTGLGTGRHTITCAIRKRISYLPFVPTMRATKDPQLAA